MNNALVFPGLAASLEKSVFDLAPHYMSFPNSVLVTLHAGAVSFGAGFVSSN